MCSVEMNEIQEFEKKYGIKLELIKPFFGKCYVIDIMGDLSYGECFGITDNEYLSNQKYIHILPDVTIKFYNYYIIAAGKGKKLWYRGWKKDNGNFEFDCYADTLEEIFDSL